MPLQKRLAGEGLTARGACLNSDAMKAPCYLEPENGSGISNNLIEKLDPEGEKSTSPSGVVILKQHGAKSMKTAG